MIIKIIEINIMNEQTLLVLTTQRRSCLDPNQSIHAQDPDKENILHYWGLERKLCIDRKACYILFLDGKTYDVKKSVLPMLINISNEFPEERKNSM